MGVNGVEGTCRWFSQCVCCPSCDVMDRWWYGVVWDFLVVVGVVELFVGFV